MKNIFNKNSLLRHPGAKIFSLVLAIMLWFYVVDYLNPETVRVFRDVPIEIEGKSDLDRQGVIILNNTPQTIDIHLNGKWKDVMSYERSKLQARVNVRGYTSGKADINIQVNTNDPVVRVKELSSRTVGFEFDEIQKVEKQIKIVTTGALEQGYQLGDIESLQKSVEVVGPSNIVKNVAYLEALIDLNGKNKSFTEHVHLVPKNTQDQVVENVELSEPVFDLRIPVIISKPVPVEANYDNQVDGSHQITSITVEPKTVVITGDSGSIDNVKVVKTKKFVVSSNETYEFKVKLEDSDLYTVKDIDEVTVNVQIDVLETKRFAFTPKDLTVNNRTTGYTYQFENTDQEISIEFTGIRSELLDLESKDIKLSIDVKDLKEGIYRLPITIDSSVTIPHKAVPDYVEIIVNKSS